jgi:hypothetical protein
MTIDSSDKTMKQYRHKSRSRKGMALLIVLFIVMTIAIISSGFIARSDAALQCGRNYCLRNEVDYLAWAGLEHAKAMVISPENSDVSEAANIYEDFQLDTSGSQYYDLTINSPEPVVSDPSTYTYSVQSTAYDNAGGAVRARSVLDATLFYNPDPNNTEAYYISVTRQ